ncbi:FCD domain-containing protein [Rhizobium sp. P38BS-XIX]|uniref:GntR family transcriptional regulator n=1 Tax=Rhizobium sp. P38BS-XIX TaxID=2726740 RepID=UPI00145754E3|nr:FCD domain-containing protein [Rhizobium sp. P38BS-XIX]NLS01267.1 FCD domain-containing protein [Rhizobium sp. P38BS-XIX]
MSKLFGNAAELANSEILSERAAAFLEHDILAGTWQPGDRLGIQALSERYEIGATPLREGLSRLVARGLVSAVGQRGFRVATVSEADLSDITQVRILVECEALCRSITSGSDEWEAGILSSLHRLVRSVERDPETMREGSAEFDHLHKSFHRSLLEACGSERLLRLHDDLYYQAYRYRRTMMSRIVDHERFIKQHKLMADIVLSRDADRAVAELSAHLRQTLKIVYGSSPTIGR